MRLPSNTPNAEGPAISRRNFVRITAGSVAALTLGEMLGCAPKTVSQHEANQKASKKIECDVLVVGGGGAGVSAAAKAAEAGAETILIEKLGWLAGSSSLALGTLYGAGTDLQRKAGIEDSPDALYQ